MQDLKFQTYALALGVSGAEEKVKRLLQKFEFYLKMEVKLDISYQFKPNGSNKILNKKNCQNLLTAHIFLRK